MGVELDYIHDHEDVGVADGLEEVLEEGEHDLEECCVEVGEGDDEVEEAGDLD